MRWRRWCVEEHLNNAAELGSKARRSQLTLHVLQGDKYSAEDGDLYFNSKTGTLDDVYGDYAFAQPEQHSSCKLGPNGAPILDGDDFIQMQISPFCACAAVRRCIASECACRDAELASNIACKARESAVLRRIQGHVRPATDWRQQTGAAAARRPGWHLQAAHV